MTLARLHGVDDNITQRFKAQRSPCARFHDASREARLRDQLDIQDAIPGAAVSLAERAACTLLQLFVRGASERAPLFFEFPDIIWIVDGGGGRSCRDGWGPHGWLFPVGAACGLRRAPLLHDRLSSGACQLLLFHD